MRVTEHFHVNEWTCRDGRPYPEEWLHSRLLPLCQTLEVIRAAIGGLPMVILSGYRSPEWNRHVGGAVHSQHTQGRAADIRVADLAPPLLHAKILELYGQGALPHLGGLGRYKSWVHVDVRPGERLARWEGNGAAVG